MILMSSQPWALPKYSHGILAIQTIVLIACIVLLMLDEHRPYAYLFVPLMISYVIQYYRLHRARQRLDQEFILHIRQAIAEHRHRELGLHEQRHTIDDDLNCLRAEIERQKVNKKEV